VSQYRFAGGRPRPVDLPRLLRRELRLSWLFVRNDRWATLVPAGLFLAAACVRSTRSVEDTLMVALGGVLYLWLYIYGFTLANQLSGIAEDAANKPDRPLVTGVCTIRGARKRLCGVAIVFPVVGWLLGVLAWALLWQVVWVLYNAAGWDRHWLGRNVLIGVGVVTQLAAAWSIALEPTSRVWTWIGVLAGAVFFLIPLADLRDVHGDREVGRRTLPIAWGETPARIYLALALLVLPVLLPLLPTRDTGRPAVVLIFEGLLGAIGVALSYRVLVLRGRERDHTTYRVFEIWYTLLLGSAVVLI